MALLSKVRERATYANVMATLALFVALAGGPFAVASLSGGEKKVVKKIAKKQANKRIKTKAPRLSVAHAATADTATSAVSASNGAAAHGSFDEDGSVKAGALNMNDLTVSSNPSRYCEDQAFRTVVASGNYNSTSGDLIVAVAAVSRAEIEAAGLTMTSFGCPANTEWIYVTDGENGVPAPGPFQVVAY